MLFLNQVIGMRNSDLRREARIDRAAAGAGTIKFGTRVVGIDYIFRLDAEALEVGVK
jgi:hypothetical protein